jgi:hypothetical protein
METLRRKRRSLFGLKFHGKFDIAAFALKKAIFCI